MEKEKNGSLSVRSKRTGKEARDDDRRKSKRKVREFSDSEVVEGEDLERKVEKRVKTKAKSRRRYNSDSSSYSDSDSRSDRSSESESAGSSSESEEERRRRRKKRKERKRREEEKERERRRRNKEKKNRKEKVEKMKKKKDKGSKGAVTNSWGKYGIIRETDMWNKRPEFTAWLMEVKQVNLEHLPNWEEKQMFKQFMEDHNTATFPSKKYYDLDAYYRHQIEKDLKRGSKKVVKEEMTVFNDEEQRRIEMMKVREKQKEEEVEALKRSMQGGMAQAMKEQAQLKEEMAYQYKVGNFEAAAAIQRRLDPDVPM